MDNLFNGAAGKCIFLCKHEMQLILLDLLNLCTVKLMQILKPKWQMKWMRGLPDMARACVSACWELR